MGRAGAGGGGGGGSFHSGGSGGGGGGFHSGGSGHSMSSHRPSPSSSSFNSSSSSRNRAMNSGPSSRSRDDGWSRKGPETVFGAGMFTPPPQSHRHDHHDHHHHHDHMPPPPPPVQRTVIIERSAPTTRTTRVYGNGYNPPPPPTNTVRTNIPPQAYPVRTQADVERAVKRSLQNSVISVIVITFIIAFFLFAMSASSSRHKDPVSTIAREKLTDVPVYMNDCVIDEIDWIRNEAQLSKKLKPFYDETGIQPFIYMRSYDPSLYTEDDKMWYAAQWFEDNLYAKGYTNALLYMYFAEEDTDNVVGYAVIRYGQRAGQIMDSEAESIFWNYLDSYWSYYDENHTDEMFEDTFVKTGNTIMKQTTTTKDIIKVVLIIVGVIVILAIVLIIIVHKRKAEKEKEAYTERILNSSMDDLVKSKDDDDLLNKYKDNKS